MTRLRYPRVRKYCVISRERGIFMDRRGLKSVKRMDYDCARARFFVAGKVIIAERGNTGELKVARKIL